MELLTSELKKDIAIALDKGLKIVLNTQIEVDGQPTIWCAQYDSEKLTPAKARAYELPSLSGSESVGIVRYLMSLENPSPEVISSIEYAIQWFEKHKILGKRVIWKNENQSDRERVLIDDPNGKALWGRFNEIQTGRPIFVGRDGVIKYDYNAIEKERRNGYNYIDDYADDLLKKDYPAWKSKHLK